VSFSVSVSVCVYICVNECGHLLECYCVAALEYYASVSAKRHNSNTNTK
jgi:hypothetical protein